MDLAASNPFPGLDRLGEPAPWTARVGRALSLALVVTGVALLALGACVFTFGPYRTFLDVALLPRVAMALAAGILVRWLAARPARRAGLAAFADGRPLATRVAVLAEALLFFVAACCFLNEAVTFFRRF